MNTLLTENKKLLINEVNVSDLTQDFRLEAEFYIAESSDVESESAENFTDFVQYGTSKGLNEDGEGYPVHRLNEFNLSFSGIPEKHCKLLSQQVYESLKLKKGDVLICRTNGNPKYVGKSALVMKDEEYAFASYLFRIRTNEKIKPTMLVTYLNSSSGRNEIEKYSMVGNQANFSPAKFRQIAVPIFAEDYQKLVDDVFNRAWKEYDDSVELFSEVESEISKAMKLDIYKINQDNIALRSLEDCSNFNRFDAEFWQHKHDDAFLHLERMKTQPLLDLCTLTKGRNLKYSENGTKDVIKTKQLKNNHIDTGSIEDKSHDGVILTDKSLLFASMGVGSLGKTDIYYKELYGNSFVTDSTIFALNDFDSGITPEYVLGILRTPFFQDLIYRYIVGASGIISISSTNIGNLPIPVFSNNIIKSITDKVYTANVARKKASELLKLGEESAVVYVEKGKQEAKNLLLNYQK